MGAVDYETFQRQRFFASLDGVRAVSVVLVILWHMPDKGFWALNGYAGVQEFFVLSGFLITTLCLRESDRSGRLGVVAFYVRRAHRILPLYALAVVAYAALTATGVVPSWQRFVRSLPYYLTLNGDLLSGDHPFRHSWTLGVEEKFYLVWPLVLLGVIRLRPVGRVAVMSAIFAVAVGLSVPWRTYPTNYIGITIGCLLATVLHCRDSFVLVRRWATSRTLVAGTLFATVGTHALLGRVDHLTLPYAVLVGASIACLLLRPDGAFAMALSTRPLRWVGARSYGIYLVHPMVIHGVGYVTAPTDLYVVRLVLAVVFSFIVADALHRFVEVPMVRRGRRVVARREASVTG